MARTQLVGVPARGTAGYIPQDNGDGTYSWVPVSASGVSSVTAGDGSISIGGTASAPTVETGTLDAIATAHPPAAAWSNNSKKITGVANGTAASDAAAFGQIPTALPPNGSASGDLSGTYPSPTVAKVQGKAIDAPTTKGDLYVYDGTALKRLAVGSNGKVLTANSTAAAGVDWETSGAITGRVASDISTLGSVTGISWAIAASEVWYFRMFLYFTNTSTVSPTFQLTGPASPTTVLLGLIGGLIGNVPTSSLATAFSSNAFGSSTTSGSHHYILHGMVVNGANAGTVQLVFGAGGTAATVKAGSHFLAWKGS